MDTNVEILKHLRTPRKIKFDEWAEFTHRKIKVENPLWTHAGGGNPTHVNKWLIEFNGKPVSIKDSIMEVNKFYGKSTATRSV